MLVQVPVVQIKHVRYQVRQLLVTTQLDLLIQITMHRSVETLYHTQPPLHSCRFFEDCDTYVLLLTEC